MIQNFININKILYRGCLLSGILLATGVCSALPLNVCCTVPDLGDLCKRVGGEHVDVTIFVKSADDPHALEARPSFIKAMSRADLYIQIGLELEIGWAPAILQACRNRRVQPNGRGFLDASAAIHDKKVDFEGQLDRSHGDVHPGGNPHYLTDPVNGLLVSKLIRDKLIELQPEQSRAFESNWNEFKAELGSRLVGQYLAEKYDIVKLATLSEHRLLSRFLDQTGETQHLSGWLGELAEYRGRPAVGDHSSWRYLTDRFGINVVTHLEPKPGMTPTIGHLKKVIKRMIAEKVPVLLTASYFPSKHVIFVADKTGASILELAHQVGARPGTENYIAMIDFNVRQLLNGFGNNG